MDKAEFDRRAAEMKARNLSVAGFAIFLHLGRLLRRHFGPSLRRRSTPATTYEVPISTSCTSRWLESRSWPGSKPTATVGSTSLQLAFRFLSALICSFVGSTYTMRF